MCAENDPECNTCTIESYPVTEYVDKDGMVINSVTSDMLETSEGTREECCAAGVSVMDEEVIRAACLKDDGEKVDELELTDQGECIKRSVQKKGFLDMDDMAIEGYEGFDEVLDTMIVGADECCKQGCMGEEFTSFLAACASRMETPGDKSYAVSDDNMFCLETQEIVIVYGLVDESEACSVTAGIEKSS